MELKAPGVIIRNEMRMLQEAVARAVLFYSPTCPHCHKVMTEDLPPLVERYGDRFVIVGVDVV